MRFSEALRAGLADPLALPSRRYGYKGDPSDANALAEWLDVHPLINVAFRGEADDASSTPTETEPPLLGTRFIRPDQARFRQSVGHAYDWHCCLSGCNVPAALEAAHRGGEGSWRHANAVEDGYLLRRDLHALYDAGLLTFDDGVARFAATAREYYADLEGRRIAAPRQRSDRR